MSPRIFMEPLAMPGPAGLVLVTGPSSAMTLPCLVMSTLSPVVRTLETLHVSGPDEPSGDVLLKRAGDFLHLKRLAVGGWVGRHEAELRNVFGATLEIVR